MRLNDWAENEIRLAKEQISHYTIDDEFDEDDREYEYAYHDKALMAYNVLHNDWCSGLSEAKQVLDRLYAGLPLTPIEDTVDMWDACSHGSNDKKTIYQCKRMPTLFKNVYSDGTVTYNAINRVLCYDSVHPHVSYHSSLVDKIIDQLIPITMPYYPVEPIKVYCHEFLADKDNGFDVDYDTIVLHYTIRPDGTIVYINRYFKMVGLDYNHWVEIDLVEYTERLLDSKKEECTDE